MDRLLILKKGNVAIVKDDIEIGQGGGAWRRI
jgi:hypothetical protein